jgi:hypothetical protein
MAQIKSRKQCQNSDIVDLEFRNYSFFDEVNYLQNFIQKSSLKNLRKMSGS